MDYVVKIQRVQITESGTHASHDDTMLRME